MLSQIGLILSFIIGTTLGILATAVAAIVLIRLIPSRGLTPQEAVEQVALPFYMKGDREERMVEDEMSPASMQRPEVYDNLEGLGK
jgi:hypothetical protein